MGGREGEGEGQGGEGGGLEESIWPRTRKIKNKINKVPSESITCKG